MEPARLQVPGGFGAELVSTLSGQQLLAVDWAVTSVGIPEAWPQSLKTLVSTILSCPTPMYMAWGPQLLSFYNDAYIPILGASRSGNAFGRPLRELWGHLWEEIGPLVESTMRGANSSMVDMPLDLRRAGVKEESWWTFTYSPVRGEQGDVVGFLCITRETTERVMATRAREQAEKERDAAAECLQLALGAGNSIGAWDWDTVADRVTADSRFALLYGVDPAIAARGAPIAAFFARIHPDDLPRVQAAVKRAMESGGPFLEEYRLVDAQQGIRWVSAQGQCVPDEKGRCVRFPGVSFDVTDRKQAELALMAAKGERDFVIKLMSAQRSSTSPAGILHRTVEELGQRLEADRCGYYELLTGGQVRFGPCWTSGRMEPLRGLRALSDLGRDVRRSLRQGALLSYAQSDTESSEAFHEQAAFGERAGLYVPMQRHGLAGAGFFFHSAEMRAWSAGEMSLVREIASLTTVAVERAEAMVRLEGRVGHQEYALALQATEIRDQTAGRESAESQVRQLQKMEAVGQLTGGIAHDFNNLLAVIMGGLRLMQLKLQKGDVNVSRYMNAALESANRAASLTQRLLAFSRQAPLAPEPVDTNRLVGGMTELLTRSLGERIRLETVLGAGLWKCRADANQLENVLLNLAVNARDAMPEGGRLTIETSNSQVDEVYASSEEMKAGQYIQISVTDTGTGMPPEVLARAFDPFFTTKEPGKGTGLGLSQVFGFARQSEGHVKCYSEVGHGTCFKVYLPRWTGELPVLQKKTSASVARGGTFQEVILVVEDDSQLRAFTVEVLRELGYGVKHAADGAEALRMLERGEAISLLFTDIVMPGATGRQLADAATAIHPGLKVLYTTGYTRGTVVHNGTLDAATNFIAKPFSLEQLAAKVRQVLDG